MNAAMTYAEIAARTGQSPEAVKAMCYHAIKKLKEQTPNAVMLLWTYAKQLDRVRQSRKVM